MADDKVTVAYIGPKKEKTYVDPETRIDHVFPQFEKVDVSASLAHRILRHKDVFVKGDELDKRKKESKAKYDAQEKERKEAAAIAAKEAAARQNTVIVNGSEIDLNKLTMAKLKTLVVAEALTVPYNGEDKDDYVAAVKAALVNKYYDQQPAPVQATAATPVADDVVEQQPSEGDTESEKDKEKSE